MTEIERKALALVIECESDYEALCRAIKRHEQFAQEVSDAVEDYCGYVPPDSPSHPITRFILTKPDPLVDAWQMAFPGNHIEDARDECAKISAAIEARGGRIVWGEG